MDTVHQGIGEQGGVPVEDIKRGVGLLKCAPEKY